MLTVKITRYSNTKDVNSNNNDVNSSNNDIKSNTNGVNRNTNYVIYLLYISGNRNVMRNVIKP